MRRTIQPENLLMTEDQDAPEADELFFEQLKDQFVLFYALTMTGMEVLRLARQYYLKQAKGEEQ